MVIRLTGHLTLNHTSFPQLKLVLSHLPETVYLTSCIVAGWATFSTSRVQEAKLPNFGEVRNKVGSMWVHPKASTCVSLL